MNSRLLVTAGLTLALFWIITPLILLQAGYAAVVVRANGLAAMLWFTVSLLLLAAALVATGFRIQRRRMIGIWLVLLFCWTLYPAAQERTLVLIQTETHLTLWWLITALIGTGLLLLLIGGRMRAAAEREWQTALLFSIVDREIGEGMALIDPRLHVHWSNAAARRFMFAEKSANGKAATSIPLNPDIERLVRRALDTGRAASQRFTLDENAHFNLQAAPQEDGYISVVAHPLSYETGPNQFYERFIRRIVHDMRNPLAAIIAHAGNLQNTTAQWSGQPSSAAASANAANAAAAANTAATIEHEAQRLTRLVDSMLFDARLSYVPLALEQVDLLDVIEEVYYQHDERAMREQKSIIVETPPESAPLEADRDLLARALSNLVDNSLKYSRAGAEVRLSLEATAENYLLRVADTGDGIPPEYLPERIFEPLVRARQKDSGSGLGLAIVKKIVQLHHGDITAESELGKGTTFTVCLPK